MACRAASLRWSAFRHSPRCSKQRAASSPRFVTRREVPNREGCVESLSRAPTRVSGAHDGAQTLSRAPTRVSGAHDGAQSHRAVYKLSRLRCELRGSPAAWQPSPTHWVRELSKSIRVRPILSLPVPGACDLRAFLNVYGAAGQATYTGGRGPQRPAHAASPVDTLQVQRHRPRAGTLYRYLFNSAIRHNAEARRIEARGHSRGPCRPHLRPR